MSRQRLIYNVFGVYASDTATGYHALDYNGVPINSTELSLFDYNRVRQIDRIQNFQYSIDISRTNVAQLGKRGLVNNYIISRPPINISFDYLLGGLRNEARLGFVVNYLNSTGEPILSQEICAFKNFTGYFEDCRNIFVAVSPNNEKDINDNIQDLNNPDSSIDPKDLQVWGFGNCYINSYSVNAGIGQFPSASVGYICDNINLTSSGSGANIPAVHPKTGNLIPGIKFVIPRAESIKDPSVFRPGDITLKVGDFLNHTGVFSETAEGLFGVTSLGMPIQSFDLSVNLEREELKSIGYVLPVDRRINFPIFAQINLSTIIEDNKSGDLSLYLNQNTPYSILIDMLNPGCSDQEIGMQFKIHNCKLEGVNYGVSVNNKLIGTFGFIAEIDMDDASKGFYISGILNAPFPEVNANYLLLQERNQTGFLLLDDEDLIIINNIPIV